MAPDRSMTCWEKAHCFYIPNGLFVDKVQEQDGSGRPIFQNVRTSSTVFKRKRVALGLSEVAPRGKRGTKRKATNKRRGPPNKKIRNMSSVAALPCVTRANPARSQQDESSSSDDDSNHAPSPITTRALARADSNRFKRSTRSMPIVEGQPVFDIDGNKIDRHATSAWV